MLQIQGIEGEAVVAYREPSITQKMRHPRLSRLVGVKLNEAQRVKKHDHFCGISRMHPLFAQQISSDLPKHLAIIALIKSCHFFYAKLG